MSYDFALERSCTHEVKFERVSFASDLVGSVRFPKPPTSQSVHLYADGVEVPRSGLWSVPEIPFGKGGPYRIVSGESDLLYLKVPGAAARLVQLPAGGSVTSSDIARELSRRLPEISVSDESGRVVLRGRSPGPAAAFSLPDPRWTDRSESLPSTARVIGAARQLGLVLGRVAAGRELFPAWTVQRDATVPLESSRVLVFSSPVRNAAVVLQLGYFTDAPNCRRCRGARVEFDYGVVNGKYEPVDGADLLLQEFDKYLFTRSGSHFKWPWLGSRLIDRVGGKGAASGMSPAAFIQVDVNQAFRTYKDVKTQQDRGLQPVSDAEYPHGIGAVMVQSPSDDPTVAVVTISITSRTREPIVLKRVVGTPDPFTLSTGGTFRLRG